MQLETQKTCRNEAAARQLGSFICDIQNQVATSAKIALKTEPATCVCRAILLTKWSRLAKHY